MILKYDFIKCTKRTINEIFFLSFLKKKCLNRNSNQRCYSYNKKNMSTTSSKIILKIILKIIKKVIKEFEQSRI